MGIVGLAAQSTINFGRHVTAGSLHLRPGRLGRRYHAPDGGAYAVFRESQAPLPADADLTVLVVGFRLKLIGSSRAMHWLFQRLCILTTPFWSGFKGFGTKLWMVEPVTKNYLGIYQWDGLGAATVYVHALVRVLNAVSVPGSVWYRLYQHEPLDRYLAGCAVN